MTDTGKAAAKRSRAPKPHALTGLINRVERTHRNLGELLAFECLCAKCKKLCIVVAPHGTGKSTASATIGKKAPVSRVVDRLTIAGLAGMAQELTNWKGVIVVDDISKTGSDYARISTMTTLAELIYSHYICSSMSKMQFEIMDFQGAAIVNIQPVLLRDLVQSQEWEASIQDKAIRYYHLKRPLHPVLSLPDVDIDWGIDLSKVKAPDMKTDEGAETVRSCRGQWTIPRTLEHTRDLLMAAAAMDRREEVNTRDHELIRKLALPLRYEQMVFTKSDFESKRELDSNRLALLTEMATYGEFSIEQLSDPPVNSISVNANT
jgi:hypothetical protein